jgi:hypothetical protein
MTPEAVFKAYDLLYAIPPEHVVNMRRVLDNARRRLAKAGGATTPSTHVVAAWSPEDEALAWLIDITRDCWCLWPIEPRIH